jgi:hypothetical protein
MAFHDSFYQTQHNSSPFIFSVKDSITILIGEKRHQTQPIFGGFITGWNKKGGILGLDCRDALLNMNGDVMYENYAIGDPPEEGKIWKQFSNLYDTLRYMAETSLHRISPYNVPSQFGFSIDLEQSLSTIKSLSQVWERKKRNRSQPGLLSEVVQGQHRSASAKIYET